MSVIDWDKNKRISDATGVSIFPHYDKLKEAKEEIMPKEEVLAAITLTDTEMIFPQEKTHKNLVDRMLEIPRIRQKLEEELAKLTPEERANVKAQLTSKEGTDGLSAESQYMQLGEDGKVVDDAKLMVTHVVAVCLDLIFPDGRTVNIETNCLCNSSLAVKPNR